MQEADALLLRVGRFHAKPETQSFRLHLHSNQSKPKCLEVFFIKGAVNFPTLPNTLLSRDWQNHVTYIQGKKGGETHT